MYNSIVSVEYQDYRVVSTVLHLIIEVCLKKLALYYELDVSLTSHSLNSLLYKLQPKDSVVDQIYKELGRTGGIAVSSKFSL